MAKEIERKFLLKNEDWRAAITDSLKIQQGYLNSDPERIVRVRTKNERGILTIKGKPQGDALTRMEYEYEVPYIDALALLKLCENSLIQKTRYLVPADQGRVWEIDVFAGNNAGLVVAEIELQSENEKFAIPSWIGEEVTRDIRYINSNLAKHPFKQWDT